ncbi:uncharacterized protein LOC126681104 [Mercurialis annua]|uniref:uncharacterized protein LOC126681104 n=1 Tax=Mercurialis annua TaxID=3986 RepID=UPI002160A8F5|nr:uncharacterized protein LOC126681104 [Mercurialis annua]
MKAIVCGFPSSCCSGLVPTCQSKQLFRNWRYNETRFKTNNSIQLCSKIYRKRIQYNPVNSSSTKKILSVRSDNYQLSYEDELPQESYWLRFIKEAIWATKSLFIFLVEQPSQLKYIEWPSFQSTLKTAVLTLVIVALLIVALSSVDAVLCYLLAILLRRPA